MSVPERSWRTKPRAWLAVCFAVFAFAAVPRVSIAADKATCVAAYEEGQRVRARGELLLSREAFRVCAEPDCPEATQGDCAEWHAQVEASLPTVVLSAVGDDQKDLSAVAVVVDGEPFSELLDGKALPLDPGKHRFVFRLADQRRELELVIREGEKNRAVHVSFAPPAVEPPADESSPIPPGSWVLGGIGIAGLSAFAIFGGLALAEKSDAEDTCAPNCPDKTVDDIRAKLIVADVSLGVGVVSLGAAVALAIVSAMSSDGEAPVRSTRLRFSPTFDPQGEAGASLWLAY